MNLAHQLFEGPPGAPTLLLLHGVTRNWRDWELLRSELARDWRVVAADHCGHGDSPRTPGSYRVGDYARHTADFIRSHFNEPVTVCGHSLGAMVALSLAAECPDHVAGCVLEDPPFHTMGRGIAETPYRAQFEGMREVASHGGSVAEMAVALADIRITATLRLGDVRSRAALEFSADCLSRVDPGIFEPLVAGQWLDGFDHSSLWPRVTCPVLLLQADPATGGALTDADAALAVSLSPCVRHHQFAGVGHQIHQTQPEEFIAVFRQWANECGLCPC